MDKKVTWEDMVASIKDGHVDWRHFFDERQHKEIRFDEIYAAEFAHGTGDHNARLIIAKLAQMLDAMCQAVEFKGEGGA